MSCVFCKKAQDEFRNETDIMVFEPLNPVTPGHLLVVPVQHAMGFESNPALTARVFYKAADVMKELLKRQGTTMDQKLYAANLITSSGTAATQTVMHLHVHIVPRRYDDGLSLPWTGQKK